MRINYLYLILTGICLLAACGSEKKTKEETNNRWYKGNLHAHSFWSDGDDFPEMIMGWYKQQGYDFAVLSDHNTLLEDEKWVNVTNNARGRRAYARYQQQYDSSWIETKKDTSGLLVRLKTLAEYRDKFEENEKFLIIPSEEITDQFEDKPIHINATNVQELVEPQHGNSVVEVMQNNIDLVLDQREKTGEPMFPHINHPNFGWAITAEDLMALHGERFFEVYNGHPQVNNFGDSTRAGTDAIWDQVLTAYLNEGKPPIYGLATDDSHHYFDMTVKNANPGRGWVMVQAQALTPQALIEAMLAGNFYATSGVTIQEIQKDDQQLKIKINPETGIHYKIQFIGTRQSSPAQIGSVFKEAEGTEAAYDLQGDELYVRAKIISDKIKKNPFQEGEYEMAWVQPWMIKKQRY